jgi:hypothetical protein
MTTRDNKLAYVLLGFIILAALGFFGYQFYLVPMRERETSISSLRNDVDVKQAKVDAIHAQSQAMQKLKKLSLPANVDQARREYGEELEKMLRASGFDAGSISVLPKQPETRTSPAFANKKPIYTKLPFTVTAKGDLASIVDWMERFYKLKLLHQIKNLTIQLPVGADSSARRGQNDLDVTMTLEALVLDNAEQRKTLQPENAEDTPPTLADSERTYASIAGKNIFYGSPPQQPTMTQRPKPEIMPFIKFDGVSYEAGTPTATLWDQYHNHDYRIRPHSIKGFNVDVSYYINGRKRDLRNSRNLELHDSSGNIDRLWEIVRIHDRELILRDEEQYYRLHIGQSLADMVPLKADEVKAMGIKEDVASDASEEEKAKDKEPAKDKAKGNSEGKS